MPMLALLLLMAGLCDRSASTGSDALRMQIQQADAQRAAGAPALDQQAATRIVRLSTDRVLRLARSHVQDKPVAGLQGQAHMQGLMQLWQHIDGRWQLQRTVSIEQRD